MTFQGHLRMRAGHFLVYNTSQHADVPY